MKAAYAPTEAQIRAAILAGLQQAAPEADLSALGADEPVRETLDIDSFDFLNFLIGLHERLGVEIPEADYGQLTTIAQMIAYVAAHAA